jgi:peptide/nickel transport system ATP-binding protein
MAENNGPLVVADALSVAIAGRQILTDVSFEIPRGGALALVGESGSGKTVTSRVFTGLLARIGGTITGGSARFDGADLGTDDERQWSRLRGREISLVPQASLSSLDPVIPIGRQLIESIRNLDRGEADARARAIDLLELVRLSHVSELMKQYPHELSGGMRQRVMIALALVGNPRFIVADEPTTALDVTVQRGILRLLGDIRRDTGMTLLMIAHDLAVVQEVAETVAVMQRGVIVEQGATDVVLTRPAHPYTAALLAARPERSVAGSPLAVLDRLTGELVQPPPLVQPPVVADRTIMSLSGVSMTFRNASSPAVAPLDLDVVEGESLGIVGESGSGKTTLGRIMVGALTPTAGRIAVEGESWNRVRRNDILRKDVQMIFQDPYGSLTPWRTPRATVAEVIRRWNGVSVSESKERAAVLLAEVGLEREFIDRMPTRLSGGQCQRAGIARALASDPRVIIADEPTSSLDVSVQAQILNLLMRLRAERGLTLVLISHDLGVIRHMTDRALVMKAGVVIERGATAELLAHPQHDYTRSLVDSTPMLARHSLQGETS